MDIAVVDLPVRLYGMEVILYQTHTATFSIVQPSTSTLSRYNLHSPILHEPREKGFIGLGSG